jgi:hypothetical protein
MYESSAYNMNELYWNTIITTVDKTEADSHGSEMCFTNKIVDMLFSQLPQKAGETLSFKQANDLMTKHWVGSS